MNLNLSAELTRGLMLALMPTATALIGGLLVEIFRISPRILDLAMHTAAGVVFGIVGVELIPEMLKYRPEWLVILIFLAGGAVFLLIDWFTDLIEDMVSEQGVRNAPWVIFLGIGFNLLTDGIMIVAGENIAGFGLSLAIATAVVEFPETFATMAAFKRRGISRRWRIPLSIALAILIMLGAAAGYWLVHGRPQIVVYGTLAFTAGFLALLMADEILPSAHQEGNKRWSAFLFVLGFAAVALVSHYISLIQKASSG